VCGRRLYDLESGGKQEALAPIIEPPFSGLSAVQSSKWASGDQKHGSSSERHAQHSNFAPSSGHRGQDSQPVSDEKLESRGVEDERKRCSVFLGLRTPPSDVTGLVRRR
jgi:hypothetical protein